MKPAAVISRAIAVVAATVVVCLITYQGITSGEWDVPWLVLSSLTVVAFGYELATRYRRVTR